MNQFSTKAKGLTAIGIVFLGITAISTMLTVDRVFNQIWHVRRERGLISKVVLYWAVISLAPMVVGLSISVSTSVIGQTMEGLGDVGGDVFPFLTVLPMFFTVLAFTILYQIIPNRAVHWTDALVGGALAAGLFEVSKRAFAAYITHFPSYTALYGALAAFPLFLLWIYCSWIIVLLGATTVAALPVARTGYWDNAERPGQRWVFGLSVLSQLEKSRHQACPGMTMEELRILANVPPDELDNILSILTEHGVVGLLSGSKISERYALICNPDTTGAQVVAAVLWFDVDLVKEWSDKLPVSSKKLKDFQDEFVKKPKLMDWLETPAVDDES